MEKCIVTGATGHIGCALIRELCAHGYDVTALVMPETDISSIRSQPVRIIYGNVLNSYELVRDFEHMDYVFHLAGVIAIEMNKRSLMERVNVQGTQNVIRACRIAHVKRLVYASSVHAIKEEPKGSSISETDVFDPKLVNGSYAKTKAEATRLVLEASKIGLDAVIVHPSGVIGPYEYTLSNMGQLLIDTATGGMKAYIDGAYNFVDVRDVARGMRLAAENGRCGECYILSGEIISIKRLLDVVTDAVGKKPVKTKLPYCVALAASPLCELYYKIKKQKPLYTVYSVLTTHTNCQFSCSKAVQDLGYRFRPAAESLRDTVLWLIESGKLPAPT